jgi:hypothetical protein
VTGAVRAANDLKGRMALIKRALRETPAASPALVTTANDIDRRLNDFLRELRGDTVLAARNENVPISISDRADSVVDTQRFSTARPTTTQAEAFRIASEEFQVALGRLRSLVENDLANLERQMEAVGAPWTPGRLPSWSGQ